jgi:hypothetical protein
MAAAHQMCADIKVTQSVLSKNLHLKKGVYPMQISFVCKLCKLPLESRDSILRTD